MSIKERYEAFENNKRVNLEADEETASRLNIKVGEKYSIFPEPKNYIEAFERLENYNGLINLELLINDFKNKFPVNERTLNDKIKIIDEFINEAENINISEAFTKIETNHPKTKHYEYLKLKYDYYKNENLEYYGYNYFFSPLTTIVYAEYFLLKDWLVSELNNLNKSDVDDSEKIKSVFIDKIIAAEELANSTLELSLRQDLFDIEKNKINDETHKNLLNKYYTSTINKYLNLVNLYKASNEQFYFLNTETENTLTDEDRIDFIAMILTGYLVDTYPNDKELLKEDIEQIHYQLKNIDTIIYETKLAELKFNRIKNTIENSKDGKLQTRKEYPKVEQTWLINDELIENIRLQYSTSNLIFNCKEDDFEIVPKIKTHDYLYSNFNIDENILRFYYSPTRMFITDNDFEKMTSSGYIGKIDRTLKPYPIKIFGAYHFRNKIHTQLSFILFQKKYFINNKKIEYLSDLVPYYMDYSDGFKKGFNDFEKECITPFLNDFSDKSDFTFKIFEYVTKNIAFQHSWFNNGGSFHINSRENDEKHITNAFEDGEKQGYFYKAWSIIFGDSKIYAAYFKEYYSVIDNKDILESIDNFEYLENNYPLTKHVSNKAKIVLNEILVKKTSLVDVIDCIDNNSNSDTKRILIDELISTYRIMSNEFMFKVNESDIIDALETYDNNLEYVYIGEGNYSKIQGFVRKIKDCNTVYNVEGLATVEFENSIKLVLLNNLMIDFFNGFFAKEIEGFENISHYKYINKYLLEKYKGPVNIEPIIEVNSQETKTIKETKPKKFPAKFHALAYILELLAESKKPPKDFEGNFKKDEIIKIGREKCKDSGQNFYNFVKDHFDFVSSNNIKYIVFKKDWKKIVLELTNNKEEIEKYINDKNL